MLKTVSLTIIVFVCLIIRCTVNCARYRNVHRGASRNNNDSSNTTGSSSSGSLPTWAIVLIVASGVTALIILIIRLRLHFCPHKITSRQSRYSREKPDSAQQQTEWQPSHLQQLGDYSTHLSYSNTYLPPAAYGSNMYVSDNRRSSATIEMMPPSNQMSAYPVLPSIGNDFDQNTPPPSYYDVTHQTNN